jgi:cell division protein FtsA
MARNIITGIDAGTSTIRIIMAEKRSGSDVPFILAASQKTSSGIRKGYVVDIDSAVKSLRSAIMSAEKTSGIPIKNAHLGIGGISLSSLRTRGSIMVSRADDQISEHDIKRVVAQSESELNNIGNRKILHTFPVSYKIDGSLVLGRAVGMKGTKLEVESLFITSLSQHIDDQIKTVENSGVAIEDIIASPYAASFSALTTQQKEAGCALVNIGSNTVSIIVFEEGTPVSLEVFPIGSTHITNDIALGFQVPLEEAEKMKLEFSGEGHSKKKLSDIIEARLDDIFDLIEAHLKKINRNGLLPAGIILTGAGSVLFSLEDIAKAALKLPAKVSTCNLEKNFSRSASSSSKDFVFSDPAWSVALGLCMIGLNEDNEDMGFDFSKKTSGFFSKLLRNFIP